MDNNLTYKEYEQIYNEQYDYSKEQRKLKYKNELFDECKSGNNLNKIILLFKLVNDNLYNIRDDNNNTLLHILSKYGHLNIIKHVITYEHDIYLFDNEKNTILHIATQKNYTEIVNYILTYYNSIYNADVILNYINLLNINQSTVLHFATLNNNLNIIKLLIEYNADISIPGHNDNTILHYAIDNCNIEIINCIIEYSNNMGISCVNIPNKFGETPLHNACFRYLWNREHLIILDKYVYIIKLLINNNADVTIHNNMKYNIFNKVKYLFE